MSEPLLNMVAKQVGNSIINGEYSDVEFRLPENLSNVVYQSISQELPSADVDETKKKLEVTNLKLFNKTLTEDEYTFINSQNLKNLELRRLELSAPFRQADCVNIVGLLERLLNPESQQILKNLTINGKNATFPEDWITGIRPLLPAVDFLNIANCTLSPQEFTNLCNSFPTISKLDISRSKVENLTGIANIPDLQFLNLTDLVFNSREKIMELFVLQKLRVLNMSAFKSRTDFTKNVKFYLQCERVLPELRILDCTGNDINLEELNKLVESHTLLEIVVLVGTPLGRTPQLDIPNRTIELLTTENLARCLKSLKYCTETIATKIPVVQSILDEMDRCIKDRNTSVEDRKEALKVILPFLIRYMDYPEIQERAFKCLASLWRKPEIFDLNERQQVIGTVLKAMPVYEGQYQEDVIKHCHEAGWSVLSTDEILDTVYTTPENIDEMCTMAAAVVDRADSFAEIVDCALTVVARLLTNLTPPGFRVFMALRPYLRITLTDMLRNHFDSLGERHLKMIFKVVHDVSYMDRQNAADPVTISVNVGCLMSFMETLPRLTDDSMKEAMLNVMDDFVKWVDVRSFVMFFQRRPVLAFIPLLLAKNTGKQRAAISVLVSTLYVIQDQENTVSPNRDKETLVNDIITSISTFQQGENDGRLDVLRWVGAHSQSGEVFEWAKWVLAKCGVQIEEGENVEPMVDASKRRRV